MTLFKKLAVMLTVAAITVTSLGAFFAIKAENAKVCDGIKLSFDSSCANGEEGNFWLGDFGRSIFFTDSEKKHASVTFTNSSDSDVKVTLRGVSSNWADQRFVETKTIPAKGSVTVETYDVKNLADTDVIYFYLNGITPNSEITFKVNYADVDYSSLTAASMQGNGKFTVSKVEKDSAKLTLAKTQGVKYTVVLEDSVFAFVRDADNFERAFAKGDKVKVYLSLDESVKDAYKGINVNGNVSEGTSIPLTIEADTTVGAEFGARVQGYAAFLNGMCGYGYGVGDIWYYKSSYDMDKDTVQEETIKKEDKQVKWGDVVENANSKKLGYLKNFFTAFNWYDLKPCFGKEEFFTVNDKNTFTIGSTIGVDRTVIYVYNRNNLADITVKTLDSSYTYTARWFDANTGEYVIIEDNISGKSEYSVKNKPSDTDYVLEIYKK